MAYRDTGRLNGVISTAQVDTTKYTQVYQATHDGTSLLPYMYRSFISFTFDGKKIEDFNLIATFDSDRMNRAAYAPFEDNVTTYSNLNGQYYWSTHQQPNTLDLNLSTDGIDQKQLDQFLYWFRPGLTKELILAEHPNRAILARVSAPPQLNLLPFEGPVSIKINEETYNTSTTLYKGDISLSFVMDQPFWYSKVNLLGRFVEATSTNVSYYANEWKNVNGQYESIFDSPDALKIIYEDGIPIGSMVKSDMLLGNGQYVTIDEKTYNCIWDTSLTPTIPNIDQLSGGGAGISGEVNGVYYTGSIAGAIISENGTINLATYNDANPSYPTAGYFYYAGTAPAYTQLSFTLAPGRTNDGYINAPSNSYASENYPSSAIVVQSTERQELRITTPNIYTSFNRIINIFKQYIDSNSTKSWDDIKLTIREDVKHSAVRAFAVKVIDSLKGNNTPAEATVSDFIDTMWLFLTNTNDSIFSATFTFNSETGEATGTFKYRTKLTGNFGITESTEDVGDMLLSNFLVIRERNQPASGNAIQSWQDTSTTTKRYSHRIRHNLLVPITNVSIIYKNMYL